MGLQTSTTSAPFDDATAIVKGSADPTKQLRIEADGITAGQTRVMTPPDANFTAARIDAAQTFAGVQTFGSDISVTAFLKFSVGSRFQSTGNGVLALQDNTGAPGSLSVTRRVSAKTTAYPVGAGDTNTFFTNTGAGAGVTFTMPTPVVGLTYEFYRDANQTVTIDVGAGVTIRVGASVTSDGGDVTLDAVGSRIRLVAISTTQWVGDLTGAATFN